MLRGHRLTPRVLELRRRDGVPVAVRMLPTALFPVEQLREIVAALPRSV